MLATCVLAAAKPVRDIKLKDPPAASQPGRGLVWKIEGGKTDVFLAGSFHLLRQQDLPYPSTLDQAYDASRQLWFEVPPGEMKKPAAAAQVMALGMLPPDQSLPDVIRPETHAKVKKWAETNPSLSPVLDRMRPWLVALTIMLTEYQGMGAGPENGIESLLQARADKDGKTTGGFETVEQQLGFLGDLSAEKQQELLDKTFEDLKTSRELLTDMIGHWRAGRDKELAAQMNKSFDGHEDLKKRLLDDRNAAWIDPIEKLLAGDTPTLVVVGAGHLTGKASVVEMLEKKGWKLTRLEP
ncbi:MAG: TraB/GumN family protein [Verrucomicrobiales bacterium]